MVIDSSVTLAGNRQVGTVTHAGGNDVGKVLLAAKKSTDADEVVNCIIAAGRDAVNMACDHLPATAAATGRCVCPVHMVVCGRM
jgi:hypothetical protein